jgi:hypothetical protein
MIRKNLKMLRLGEKRMGSGILPGGAAKISDAGIKF